MNKSDAQDSLWRLYRILEALQVVSENYSTSGSRITMSMDLTFIHKYWKET